MWYSPVALFQTEGQDSGILCNAHSVKEKAQRVPFFLTECTRTLQLCEGALTICYKGSCT